MNNYLEIRAIYHSAFAEEEKRRRKAELKNLNRDFYEDLPYQIREIMDNLRWVYKDQPWFEEAWEKYRKHVLDAGLGGKIKMPGFVFNEYIDKYVDEQEKKMKKEFAHMDTCDIEELYHHGVKGQKWGVRRYQNEDGTLTDEGKKLYFQKINAANNQLKALRAGDQKAADYWQKKQDEIAAIERKNKVISMNKLKMLGKKDYKKFVKESKKSVERGSAFLMSLGLQTHTTTLDLE